MSVNKSAAQLDDEIAEARCVSSAARSRSGSKVATGLGDQPAEQVQSQQ